MADKTIPALTDATLPLTGSETIHIVQGGDSREVALSDVAAISTGAMLKATYDPNDDGIIAVAQGGSGSATAAGARTNYGLGTIAVQNAATVAITGGSITGITDITVADGGTGASTSAAARANLELVYGVNVQAWSVNLDGFAATTVTNVTNRDNHHGTQLAATISDFSTAADARVSNAIGDTVQAYSAALESISDLSLTAGDIIYATGANTFARLPVGANGQVLALQDGVPQWDTELVVGGLLAANNLSDVDSADTTLTNLGAGATGKAILADVTANDVHDDLAIDWSGATAGAPTLSLPNIMQRRYVDVGAYCSLTDTNDAHAAIQAAFDDANGREIVFTNPYGGTRFYRSLTRPTGTSVSAGVLTMPKKARIIMEPGALLDFSGWANSGNAKYLLYAKGTEGTPIDLASNAAAGATSLVMDTGGGASFSRGGWYILVSDAFFTVDDGTVGTKGEWVYVQSKSTDTLTLGAQLRDTYNTADNARLYPVEPCQLTLEGMNLVGCGNFSTAVAGDRGIWIDIGTDCRIIGGKISRSDQLTATFVNIRNGLMDGLTVEFDAKNTDAVNQYGPHLSNVSEACKIINCDISGGKEAIGLTGSGGIQGPIRDAVIAHNRMRGAWRSGFCTHDTHENIIVESNLIESCEQGVDNRIIGGTYRGNVIRNLGTDNGTLSCGFQLGSGAGKLLIDGNTIEDALRGVYMPGSIVHEVVPDEIHITNNVMRGVTSYGVLLENTTADTSALGQVRITDNDIGDDVTFGVEMEGKFTNPVVARNIIRGGDGGGRCIYLHATGNGAGTNGSIDPVVVDNVYGNYLAPLIQHASGITKNFRNTQIGAWTSGDRLTGSKTFDWASIAAGAFASTTVTVTGAALGDLANVTMSVATVGLDFFAQATSANTVTVWARNFTGSPVDVASGTLLVEVVKA